MLDKRIFSGIITSENVKAKYLAKKIVLRPVFFGLASFLLKLMSVRARIVFNQTPRKTFWFGLDKLKELHHEYSSPKPSFQHSEVMEILGDERAREILDLVHPSRNNSFLELGSGDGMVCRALQRVGKKVVAIDIQRSLDRKVMLEGIPFVQSDASDLPFKDRAFDFVFSYCGFEHFEDPESVLGEALRVAKIGGHIYLMFRPLYMSPRGRHIEKVIAVPYCQLLFPENILKEFARTKGITLQSGFVNRWSVGDFRRLWEKFSHRLKTQNPECLLQAFEGKVSLPGTFSRDAFLSTCQ